MPGKRGVMHTVLAAQVEPAGEGGAEEGFQSGPGVNQSTPGFNCCHGTLEAGHSRTCPYDKGFWGPGGVDFSRVRSGAVRGIDFHDSSMALRHGPGSAYAKNFTPQSAPVPAAEVVAKPPAPPKRVKPSPQVSESLF